MTPKEIWNRGNNLVATALLALAAFSFLPEFFTEDEWLHKLDEGLLFLLALHAIGWYLRGKNKFQHSLQPVILVWIGFAIKSVGTILELKDKADVGDDMVGHVFLFLAALLVTYLYVRAKKALDK